MLQAAFGHEESFFNTPKAWKASFRRVFDDITCKILHLLENLKIRQKKNISGLPPAPKIERAAFYFSLDWRLEKTKNNGF